VNLRAFSLVELLAALAILAILGTLSTPAIGALIERGRSARCVANLRQIGVAVQQYATDHDYRFPAIETDDYELGNDGQPASVALAPYGITPATLTCPTDLATTGNIKEHGCSYHFSPRLQDELLTNVNIYGRRGIFQVPDVGRLTVCSDYQPVHAGPGRLGLNLLKADGRVIQR
jgi:prepilin-type N-terminal cleavage/methylation domain-containing protein